MFITLAMLNFELGEKNNKSKSALMSLAKPINEQLYFNIYLCSFPTCRQVSADIIVYDLLRTEC